MKDIKIKKISTDKIPEVVETNVETTDFSVKKNYSTMSLILFGFMTVSMMGYVFMISTSVYYAVKINQFSSKEKSISFTSSSSIDATINNSKSDASRISYVNKDLDTSITLK